MTTTLAKSPQNFLPANIPEAERLAEKLAISALLPDTLRGKPNDVLIVIITGHELGLSPMQAIRGLHVVKGRAVMSADLAVALVKKHDECTYFKLIESSGTIATYETERRGEGKTRLSFTLQQAQQAQLGGDNWRKYPDAMLRARCSLALARAVYPDLMLGVYDPDEIPDAQVVPLSVAPPAQPQSKVTVEAPPKQAPKAEEKIEDAVFTDAPDAPDAPADAAKKEPTKVEQALDAIASAKSLPDLAEVVNLISGLGVGGDKAVRDAYGAKQKELRGQK